jgi:hypothetical protein
MIRWRPEGKLTHLSEGGCCKIVALARRQSWTRCIVMTATAHTGSAPTPAAIRFPSWLEASVSVLGASPGPMRASDIVAAVLAGGYEPPTRTSTPAQSVNRDLHDALRRGDTRVVAGPARGQFHAATPPMGAKPSPAPNRKRASAPTLPILPLAALISARGGLAACGVRHQAGDGVERVRWTARLQRALHRARRNGFITYQAADTMCVMVLQCHPQDVFGDVWWDAGQSR